jgi:hypothetical protein
LLILSRIFPARSLSWYGMVGVGLCFCIMYSTVVLLTGFFDDYDWSKIESFLPPVRYARKRVRIV